MKQHLRVIAEVVGLVWLTQLAGVLLMNVAILPFTLHNVEPRWSVPAIIVFNFVIGPCVAGFVHGWKRVLPLRFWIVFVGWIVGWQAYSTVMGALMLRHAHHHRTGVTPWLWMNWLITIGELLLMALLPAITTMWGQRRGTSRSRPEAVEVVEKAQ